MAKIFSFDPHEAASRAEAARRQAEREAAIAAEAERRRQEGERAALRERAANVWLRNELTAEEKKDRKERVHTAMERPAPVLAPSTPLPDPNSFVGIKVMWGDHSVMIVERLGDLARLANRWRMVRGPIQEAARRKPTVPPLNIRNIAEHDIIGTVHGSPDIARKDFRGAVAWFVLNVDEAANARANLRDGVHPDDVKMIFLTIDEDGQRVKSIGWESIGWDQINADAPLSPDAAGNVVPPNPPKPAA